MKVSEHFILQEFVSKAVWNRFGEKSIWFVPQQLIDLAEFFRARYGKPVIINDWYFGKKFQNRGFRSPGTKVGASYSQHRFGRALDMNVVGMTPKQMYDDIVANWDVTWPLTTVEDFRDTGTWVHCDFRNVPNQEKLLIVRG